MSSAEDSDKAKGGVMTRSKTKAQQPHECEIYPLPSESEKEVTFTDMPLGATAAWPSPTPSLSEANYSQGDGSSSKKPPKSRKKPRIPRDNNNRGKTSPKTNTYYCIGIKMKDIETQGEQPPAHFWTPEIIENSLKPKTREVLGNPTEVFIVSSDSALLFWGPRAHGKGLNARSAERLQQAIQGEIRFVGDCAYVDAEVVSLHDAHEICEIAIRNRRQERLQASKLKARKVTRRGSEAMAAEALKLTILEEQRAMAEEKEKRCDPRGRRLKKLDRPYYKRSEATKENRYANVNNSNSFHRKGRRGGGGGGSDGDDSDDDDEDVSDSSTEESEEDERSPERRGTRRNRNNNNTKIRLPSFGKNVDDGASYRIWRHDVVTYLLQEVDEKVLIRAMLDSLERMPGEIARTVPKKDGAIGIVEALDLKYSCAKSGPALEMAYYELSQEEKESPASWATRLEIMMKQLQMNQPIRWGAKYAEPSLAYQFAYKANDDYRETLKNRWDDKYTFEQLQRKARNMESEGISNRTLIPAAERTASNKGTTANAPAKKPSNYKPHYVKSTQVADTEHMSEEAMEDVLDWAGEEGDLACGRFMTMVNRVSQQIEDKRGACFECGDPGHRYRECPRRLSRLNGTGGTQKDQKTSKGAPPKKEATPAPASQ